VRVVLLSMLAMFSAPKAEACPHGTMCVSAVTRGGDATQAEVPRPRSMLQLAVKKVELSNHLAKSLRTYVVTRSGSAEMPWIWQVLRTSVYSRMPRYERLSQRAENRFSFVVSPVVVSSPQDTVAGLGLEGGF
jgi:hypothetical protein